MNASNKVIALGLDGVPLGLIEQLTAAGEMPCVAKLLGEGSAAAYRSTLPAVSSASWASVMTGCNPGKHGVFGFFSLDRNRQLAFPNYATLQAAPVWDYLGDRELRTIAVNVPHTYPARPHPGILVSGFVAIDFEKSVHPLVWKEELKKLDYRIDVDYARAPEEPERFFTDLFYLLERRALAMTEMLSREDWHLALLVFTGTDRLHHFFYRDFIEGGKYQDRFVAFYRQLDTVIGRIVADHSAGAQLMLLADHGFCPLQKEVYVNHWLEENGYLAWLPSERRVFAAIAPASRAFCLEPGRIYLNRDDRFANGAVAASEVEPLSAELRDRLARLAVAGVPVVDTVYRGTELYNGQAASRAPDLVMVGKRGYELKGSISYPGPSGVSRFQGMHTHDDAFLYVRGAALREGVLTVADIAPTICGWLGVEKPAGMDGVSAVNR